MRKTEVGPIVSGTIPQQRAEFFGVFDRVSAQKREKALLEQRANNLQQLIAIEPVATNNSLLSADPTIHGSAIFTGTTVPINELFGNLIKGLSLNEILAMHPELTHEAAVAALKRAENMLYGALF